MFRYSLFGFFAVLSIGFLSQASFAQSARLGSNAAVVVYSFNTTGSWSEDAKWSPTGPVPGGAAVEIANGVACTMDVDASVSTITIKGGTGGNTTLTLNSSLRTLTTTGAVAVEAPTSGSNITNSIDVGSGTLTIGSGLTLTGGTSTRIANLSIGSGTVNITGDITSSNAQGRVTFTTSGTLALTGNFPDNSALTLVPSNGNIAFNGTGAQNIGGGRTFADLTVDVSGTKTVTTSGITVNGGIIRKGTAEFSRGGQTLGYGINSRVEYSGTLTQTTGEEFTSSVVEVKVDNPGGVDLTGGSRTVTGGMFLFKASIFRTAFSGTTESRLHATQLLTSMPAAGSRSVLRPRRSQPFLLLPVQPLSMLVHPTRMLWPRTPPAIPI